MRVDQLPAALDCRQGGEFGEFGLFVGVGLLNQVDGFGLVRIRLAELRHQVAGGDVFVEPEPAENNRGDVGNAKVGALFAERLNGVVGLPPINQFGRSRAAECGNVDDSKRKR